jgi:autotransporter-associated beta strand protein
MKKPNNQTKPKLRFARSVLALALLAALSSAPVAHAAEIQKTNDETVPLYDGTAWVGGTAPGATDVAVFDSTITGAIAPVLGDNQSWKGIKVTNPGGLITIANTVGAALTNGPAGIDLSAASQNLTISSGLRIDGDQTWNVASGRLINSTVAIPNTAASYPRGVVNFTGAGTNRVANANVGNIIGGWALFGGTTWATKSGADVVGFSDYFVDETPLVTGNTRNHSFNTPGTYTYAGTTAARSMRFTAAGPVNINYTGTGNNLRLDLFAGILVNAGAGPVTFGSTGTGTGVRIRPSLAAGAPIFFIQNSANDLTLNIPIHATSVANNNTDPLVKSGSGRLILNYLNGTTAGGWFINQGTLSVSNDLSEAGAPAPLGTYPSFVNPTAVILNGGTLQTRAVTTIGENRGITLGVNGGGLDANGVAAPTPFTINSVIASSFAGVGDLTISQSGAAGGSVTLGAVNTYSGNTYIASGTLALAPGASISDTPSIHIAGGATFDVSASSGFTLASGKTLATSTAGGTASVIAGDGNALTLDSGANVSLQASGTASTVCKISVAGNLTLNATPIAINIAGETLEAGVYRLMDCTGTLTGTANVTPILTGAGLAPGTAATISTTTGSGGHVDLIVTVTNGDPAPAGMFFSVQPPISTVAGATMSPAVVVTVTNAAGSAYTTRQAVVTLSVVSPGGTLLGTVSQKTSLADGKATFNDLSVTLAGTGKTLRATNIFGAITATSSAFTITTATPVKLALVTQPSPTAAAGVAFSPQPVIHIQDEFGNLTSSGASVTVAQNVGGSLQGTTTLAASGGVATFSGLFATNVGTIHLAFTSTGLAGVNSPDILVGPGAATYMAISSAIGTNQFNNTAFTPTPEVRLFDQYGNLSDSTANVTANVGSVTGGTLAGTTTVSAGGVGTATFFDLNFVLGNSAAPETGVEVYYTSPGLPPVTNVLFTVNPNVLVSFVQEPSSATAGVAIQPNVTVLVTDTLSNPVSGQTVTMVKLTGDGTLYGTVSAVTAGNGVATFPDLNFRVAGDKTLRAAIFGTAADSTSFTISAGAFTQLQVLAPGETNAPDTVLGKTGTPQTQFVGGPFDATVNAVDAFFNIDPNAYFLVNVTTSDAGDIDPAPNFLSAGTQLFSVTPMTITSALTVTANDGISLNNTSANITVVPFPKYLTRQDGRWNDFNTWKIDQGFGAGFVNAVSGQTPSSLDGTITITNTVTLTNSLSVDQVTITSLGQLVVTNATLTIVDGPDAVDMLVAGILKNQGTGVITATGALRFTSTGKYDHNRNGGAVPTATWDAGSTCEITGITTTRPTNLEQEFHHFIWNCPGHSGQLNLSSTLTTINGNFIVQNSGSAGFGGFRLFTDDVTLTVGGNFEVVSGQTVSGPGGGDTGTILVKGNVNIPGPNAMGDSGGSCTIAFGGDGSVVQIFTVAANSMTVGKWNIRVDSGARVQLNGTLALLSNARALTVNGRMDMNTNQLVSGSLVANSGGTVVSAHANGLNGSFSTGGPKTFDFGVNFIFNGAVAQNVGSLLPAFLNDLFITNAAGVTISGTHTLNELIVPAGSRLEGSGSNNITANSLTLAGTTVMKLNRMDEVVTSDQFWASTITATGPLLVTNVGPTLLNETTFQLFGAGVSGFTPVTLPGAPYVWANNLTTAGSITLTSGGTVFPPTLEVSQTGSTLTFSWSKAGYKLQSQTNNLSTGLTGTWFDYPGGDTSPVNVDIDPANPTVFFQLVNQ